MASVTDICNLALARLGDEANVQSIDPPDGSAQATHCARFYALARDSLLAMHSWGFATRREALAALVLPDSVTTWAYAYAMPNQCVQALAVLPSYASSDYSLFIGDQGGMPAEQALTVPYVVESLDSGATVVLTNQEDATLRFVRRVEDTNLFPPLFVDALSWLLASHLAGPVVKGDAGAKQAQQAQQAAMQLVAQARTADSRQRSVPHVHLPPWTAARL